MPCTDTVADFLTRIRNASRVKHERLDMPASKLKEELANVLKQEGYIKNFKRIADYKQGILRVYLKYDENNNQVITDLQRISKPGCRVYYGYNDLPKVQGGMGIIVLSTSKGVMTGLNAKQQKVGGEALCAVW